jgi:hypothetical protein
MTLFRRYWLAYIGALALVGFAVVVVRFTDLQFASAVAFWVTTPHQVRILRCEDALLRRRQAEQALTTAETSTRQTSIDNAALAHDLAKKDVELFCTQGSALVPSSATADPTAEPRLRPGEPIWR